MSTELSSPIKVPNNFLEQWEAYLEYLDEVNQGRLEAYQTEDQKYLEWYEGLPWFLRLLNVLNRGVFYQMQSIYEDFLTWLVEKRKSNPISASEKNSYARSTHVFDRHNRALRQFKCVCLLIYRSRQYRKGNILTDKRKTILLH